MLYIVFKIVHLIFANIVRISNSSVSNHSKHNLSNILLTILGTNSLNRADVYLYNEITIKHVIIM